MIYLMGSRNGTCQFPRTHRIRYAGTGLGQQRHTAIWREPTVEGANPAQPRMVRERAEERDVGRADTRLEEIVLALKVSGEVRGGRASSANECGEAEREAATQAAHELALLHVCDHVLDDLPGNDVHTERDTQCVTARLGSRHTHQCLQFCGGKVHGERQRVARSG